MSSPSAPLIPLIIAPKLVQFPFGEHLVLHLLERSSPSGSSRVNVLISPLASVEIPSNFGLIDRGGGGKALLANEGGKLRFAFGTAGNKKLVQRIVEEEQVNVVFLFFDEFHGPIVERTRHFLLQLCALLEALRQCQKPPTLVPIFFLPSGEEGDNLVNGAESGRVVPMAKCRTEENARLASAHALLHSFAVSYRLNIQIAAIHGNNACGWIPLTMDRLLGLARKAGGKADIERMEEMGGEEENGTGEDQAKSSSGICLGRLLLFGLDKAPDGANPKLGQDFDGEMAELLAEGIELVEASTRPGLDTDEEVEEEVLSKGVSHLGFLCGGADMARMARMAAWESGGPGQLRDNVRHNLFTPWLLRQISHKFGLKFLLLTDKKQEDDQQNPSESATASSRYEAVRHFSDKLATL